MITRSNLIACISIILLAVAIALASNGLIVLVKATDNKTVHQVSNDSFSRNRFEPSSASGSSTWATSWLEMPTDGSASNTHVAPWNGSSAWTPDSTVLDPTGFPLGDVYLSWDKTVGRSHFVFVGRSATAPASVYFGHSGDASGLTWTTNTQAALVGTSSHNWDFPSVGVNNAGLIVVGAVSFPLGSSVANGYFSAYSTDGGSTWHGPYPLPSMPSGGGAQSRLVATDTHFEAFVPTLTPPPGNLPTNVSRYESSDGINWTSPIFLINAFGPPPNNSPTTYCNQLGTKCGSIFYAPLLDAKGYTNGLWTVGFQVNNGGWNNMVACGSNLTPTCRFVNAGADDEFLTGVSVGGDGGYWFSYLTYSTLNTRQLPLIVQSFYIPPGKAEIGASTYLTIDPTSWWLSPHTDMNARRCMNVDCFAAGDFNGISSNQFASASTPFVQIANPTTRLNDVFQVFPQDPEGSSTVANFVPNVIPITAQTDLLSIAVPVPPNAMAVAPGDKVGFPGSNH